MSKKSTKKQIRKEIVKEVTNSKIDIRNVYFCGFKLNKKTPDNYEW